MLKYRAALAFVCSLKIATAEFNPVTYVFPDSYGSSFQYYGDFHHSDLDSDGRQDVVTYYQNNGLYWQRSLGSGDLIQLPLSPPQILTDATLEHLRIGDLDGDGYPDLLASRRNHPSNNEIFWLRNSCEDSGSPSFDTEAILISDYSSGITALFLEDIDSDGDLDVISATNYSSVQFYLHENKLNESEGGFGTPVLLFGSGRYLTNRNVVFQDFDSDGDLDVATTLFLAGGKETIVWLENTLVDFSGYGLKLIPELESTEDLPSEASAPTLAIALIQGELWFRFLGTDQPMVTFRESDMADQALELERLQEDLKNYWIAPPDSFQSLLLMRKVTKITGFKTNPSIQLIRHDLFSGYLPESVQPNSARYFSPNQYICADYDGDGDVDFFAGYTGSYGPMVGWFENRLNEPDHGDISGFQEMSIEFYDGIARASDVDGNGFPDLIYKGTDNTIRVLYDFQGLSGDITSWTEVVRKIAYGDAITYPIGDFTTMDLDGDGDQEILSDSLSFTGTYLFISENLASDQEPNLFDRYETELIAGLLASTSFRYLRAGDPDGDGATDLSLGSDYSYRNDYATPPTFGFSKVANLGEFVVPVADPSELFEPFEQWLAAQPWQRMNLLRSRYLADVDLDGDMDVIALHGVRNGDTNVSWFENQSAETPEFRGPLGISGNVDEDAFLVCADYDSDGDPDVLALTYNVRDGGKYRRVIAFENHSAAEDWVEQFVKETMGLYRNSINNPQFSATLQSSDNLDWATAETIPIPAIHLSNPAAMKLHMKWLDPAHPKRFFRLKYSLGN